MSTDSSFMKQSASRLWISRRVRAVRTFSFPVSFLPVLLVTAAVRPLREWRWDILTASAIGAVSLHAGGNLLNDYFDFLYGVDTRTHDDLGRPGRLLVRREMCTWDYLLEAAFFLALAAAMAVYVLAQCGPQFLWFVAAGVFGLYAYTGPPFTLKYRALGEPLIFLVFGPLLMLGAAYVQTGRWDWTALLLSIPVGFLTTAILLANNARDLDEDSHGRVRTLAQMLGGSASRILYAALVVAALIAIAFLGAVGLGPRALLVTPALLALHWRTLRQFMRAVRIPDIDARTAQFETAVLVFVFLVFVLGK